LIARFYNIEGKEVEAKIRSFTPHITIWMTNLNEDPFREVKACGWRGHIKCWRP